jgi:hypothetical protein
VSLREFFIEGGTLDPDEAREVGAEAGAGAVDVKWLPGPVSWLGSGAINGFKRYLLA